MDQNSTTEILFTVHAILTLYKLIYCV